MSAPLPRFVVDHDWRRYERRYAVIDLATNARPILLQTDNPQRAREFCDECNAEEARKRRVRAGYTVWP